MTRKERAPEIGDRKIGDIERLRAVAIAAVLFIHLSMSRTLFQKAGLNDTNMPFWLGVELFFVISGFVVSKSFLAKNLSFRAFYLKRIFRLWPVLLFCYALAVCVNGFQTFATVSWPVFFAQMPSVFFGYYLLHPLPPGQSVYYTGAMWSLCVEEQFYFAAPTVLFLLSRFRLSRPAVKRLIAFGLFFCFAMIVRLALTYPQVGGPILVRTGALVNYLAHWRFEFLAAGVLLYFFQSSLGSLGRLSRPVLRSLLVTLLVAPFVAVYYLGTSFLSMQQMPGLHTFGYLFACVCFTGVVAIAALDRDLLATPRPLDGAVLYLGSRSYGIYVLHFTIFVICWIPTTAFIPWLYALDPIWNALVQVIEVVIVGFPIVEFSYRFIETPCLKLGSRLARRFVKAGEAAVVAGVIAEQPEMLRRAS